MDEWWEVYGRANTEEEIESYRLWYEFLKLSDKSKWTSEVKENFGDVSGSFEEWWPEHAYLFRKMADLKVTELISDDDFQWVKDNPSCDEYPGIMGLAIPLWLPKDELLAQIKTLISKYHKTKIGRPEFDGVADVCTLDRKPDNLLLNKALIIYKIHTSNQVKAVEDQLEYWEIEEVASKIKPVMGKESYLSKLALNEPSKYEKQRRNSQRTTVQKYIRLAEEILENVVLGDFPVYTLKKTKQN